jgi:hypothetical protein
MLKKSSILVITLLAVGLAVVPQVQAQTRQQQQELEQIARRSMNGLSPQDRQRVIQIMTDVFTAQGIPRQQAAMLAETNADSMFFSDIGEMSPAERRQFEESQRMPEYLQNDWNPTAGMQQQQTQQHGESSGWPTAAVFRNWDISNIRQPAGTQSSYTAGSGNSSLNIFLTGASANTLQEIRRQIESAVGRQMSFFGQQGQIKINERTGKTLDLKLEDNLLTISFWYSGG